VAFHFSSKTLQLERVMKMQWLSIAVATVVFVGCSSSNSTQAPNDMDAMAASLDQPKPSSGPAAATSNSAPTAPAGGATQTAVATAADPALRSKRGFGLTDWSNEAAYVLVKADAAKTAGALVKAFKKGKVVKDVFGKPSDERKDQVVVFQLAGHPWSIFACDASQIEEFAKTLSRDTDMLGAWNSDFNGWSGIQLYRGGEEVEAVHWGFDEDKIGEDADASKWQTTAQIPRKLGDETLSELYLFRSKARKVAAPDLQKGQAFIDAMFRQNDAYLPEIEQMPWAEAGESETITSPLGPAAFAAVHLVEFSEGE
jgi:hypothetical protein